MAAVISVFIVLVIWRFLILLGEVTFESAGLPTGAARFEARSALSGAGYTTTQSELIIRNAAARRVASMLVLSGYFGPGVLLALLGVSFVVPTDTDLTQRAVALTGLVVAFVVLDRTGVLRLLSARPARTLAQRMITTGAIETWVEVGDHVVAAASIPHDRDMAEPVLALLASSEVTILGLEPAETVSATIPTPSHPADPQPGDRVVVFGPQHAVAALRPDRDG